MSMPEGTVAEVPLIQQNKSSRIWLYIFLGLIFLMAVTNPGKDEFTEYVQERFESTLAKEQISDEELYTKVMATTKRENYILLSAFVVQGTDTNVEFFGLFDRWFIKIPQPGELQY